MKNLLREGKTNLRVRMFFGQVSLAGVDFFAGLFAFSNLNLKDRFMSAGISLYVSKCLISTFFRFHCAKFETCMTWCMCVHAQENLQDLRDLKEGHMWSLSHVQNMHGSNGTCWSQFP